MMGAGAFAIGMGDLKIDEYNLGIVHQGSSFAYSDCQASSQTIEMFDVMVQS